MEYKNAVKGLRIRIETAWRRQWVRLAAVALAIPTVLLACAAGYYYISFARLIDARLQGARERVLPRVFGRPLELRRGQTLTERQLETLRCLVDGLPNREISAALDVKEGTVKMHVANVIKKLGARSRTHAAAIGRKLLD